MRGGPIAGCGLGLVLGVAAAGCYDPQFDHPRCTVGTRECPSGTACVQGVCEQADALPPDIAGHFLLAIDPSIQPGSYIQFYVTLEVVNGDLHSDFQPLHTVGFPDRVPVGDLIHGEDTSVDVHGRFRLRFAGLLPAMADPISGGSQIDVTLDAEILSDTEVCGIVARADAGPLLNSTFGALRVVGPAVLPPAVAACPGAGPDAAVDAPDAEIDAPVDAIEPIPDAPGDA